MITKIKAVRVQEVIMSGSSNVIGNIRFNEINESTPISTKQLPQARPLFNNFSHYPTVNEIVYILGGPKDNYNSIGGIGNYYLPPLNINGSPHHNAQPNELTDEELPTLAETGLKDYFQEIENVRPLQPYLGDIILEGRYGQSLRFGSTINTNPNKGGSHQPNNWSNEGQVGNPITIIRNGQTNDTTKASFEHILEDVNGDDSSIYLCSNQQITNFQKAGISPRDYPTSYKHML
tara:strand:+ start:758 stop:1459 length:702 start_codon:yes stop_codon:yes gene_type:complete